MGPFWGFRNGNFGFRSGIFALCAFWHWRAIGNGELGGASEWSFSYQKLRSGVCINFGYGLVTGVRMQFISLHKWKYST
jgi:hypothetical protein